MNDRQPSRSGRPRDAQIRTKVLLAAQRLYARSGYAGVTFDALAREAGVGKPAIYRRWDSREELMADVLRSHELVPENPSESGIRHNLWQIAVSTLRLVHSEQGTFLLRVSSEREWQPELFDQYFERLRTVIHFENRALVVAAIERGELSSRCDPDILIHSITGSLLVANLMGLTPHPDADAGAAEDYCWRLVDQVLRGVAPSA